MSDDKATLEKVSDQLNMLQLQVRNLQHLPRPSFFESTHTARMRLSLLRARNAFRRLGHGCVALSSFTFVAFLAALFDAKLSLLTGFITVTAGLFLGIVGYLFYMQADSIDLEGFDEP